MDSFSFKRTTIFRTITRPQIILFTTLSAHLRVIVLQKIQFLQQSPAQRAESVVNRITLGLVSVEVIVQLYDSSLALWSLSPEALCCPRPPQCGT